MQTITSLSHLRASMLDNGMVNFMTNGCVTTGNTNGYRGEIFTSKSILIRKNLNGTYMLAYKEKASGVIAKIEELKTIAKIKEHFTK